MEQPLFEYAVQNEYHSLVLNMVRHGSDPCPVVRDLTVARADLLIPLLNDTQVQQRFCQTFIDIYDSLYQMLCDK